MKFSTMTVSFPLDKETFEEICLLCAKAEAVDDVQYALIMHLEVAKSDRTSGFCVLAYDEEADDLVGLASVVDVMGFHTFEWSLVVAPSFRQQSIGQSLLQKVYAGLSERGAQGALALTFEKSPFGAEFLLKNGYEYSFSEATSQVEAQDTGTPLNNLVIRPYQESDQKMLIHTFVAAFGDHVEEAQDLIAYHTSSSKHILWVAVRENNVVGTVTTCRDGHALWLTALAVHPHNRGLGIGTALVKHVVQLAFDNGQKDVLLNVEMENEYALSIYEKAGFVKTMQIDYYIYVKSA